MGKDKQKQVSHSHTFPPLSVFCPAWHCEWELLQASGWGWEPQDPRKEPGRARMISPLKIRPPGSGVSLVTGAASLCSESGFYHALQCTRTVTLLLY